MANFPVGGLLAQLPEGGHKVESRGTGLAAQGNGLFVLEPQFSHLGTGARDCPLEELSAGWSYSPCLASTIHLGWALLPECPPWSTSLQEPLLTPGPAMAAGEGAS